MNENKEKKYNLFQSDKKFRDETITSFYFVPTVKSEKKSCPIDIDGERFKLDLETGEKRNYYKSEVNDSIQASIRRTKILLDMLLNMNDFDWFCTLTFDNNKIDRADDQQVFNCYVKYIDNLKHQFPNLRYISFPERHEDFCIHFHILIAGVSYKALGLRNSGKVCCHWATWKNGIASHDYFMRTRNEHELHDTDGLTIYNITNFAYGFTTAMRIADRARCNTYVKKYVDKALGSTDIFRKRFYYSSNLNVPEIVKRQIGADFETPKSILRIPEVITNPINKFSDSKYYSEKFNVLQCRVSNDLRQNLDLGLEPVTEYETQQANEIFAKTEENKQQSMFDKKIK